MFETIYNFISPYIHIGIITISLLILGAFLTWVVSMFYSNEGVVTINEYHPLYWYRYSLMAPTAVLTIFAKTVTSSYYRWSKFFTNVHLKCVDYCQSEYSLCGMYWQQIFSLCIILPINLFILLPLAIVASLIVGIVLAVASCVYYPGVFIVYLTKIIYNKLNSYLDYGFDKLDSFTLDYRNKIKEKNAIKYKKLPIEDKLKPIDIITSEYFSSSNLKRYQKLTSLNTDINSFLNIKNKKISDVREIIKLLDINSRFTLLLSLDTEIKTNFQKINRYWDSTNLKNIDDQISPYLQAINQAINIQKLDLKIDTYLFEQKLLNDKRKENEQKAEELRLHRKRLWKKRWETALQIYRGYLCPKIVYKK